MPEQVVIVKPKSSIATGFGLACGCFIFLCLIFFGPPLVLLILGAAAVGGAATMNEAKPIERPSPNLNEAPLPASPEVLSPSSADVQYQSAIRATESLYVGMPMESVAQALGSEGNIIKRSSVNGITLETRQWPIAEWLFQVDAKDGKATAFEWR